jgi:hypothetical protein
MLELIQRGAPTADSPNAAAAASSSVQIALFSLGNLAAHADCAAALRRLGLAEALAAALRARGDDATVQRYAARIRQKMAAQQQG